MDIFVDIVDIFVDRADKNINFTTKMKIFKKSLKFLRLSVNTIVNRPPIHYQFLFYNWPIILGY